jgi:hypothetical protein
MSDGNGMHSLLKCVLLGARGFLLLRPFMLCHLRLMLPKPEASGAYPKREAPGHV